MVLAVSFSTPVGSPFSSLSISPPGGSGVFRSIPASFSARLLTQRMWAQVRIMDTGASLHPLSRS